MDRRRRTIRSVALVGLVALLVPVAGQATKPAPTPEPGQVNRDGNPNRGFYATDTGGNLVSFSARAPRLTSSRKITGLPGGVSLVGIDFRPGTGDLYGIGSDSAVYRVNPTTAIAVAEGPAFTPALNGRYFGVDFNPTVDLVRLTSDFDQNLAIRPDAGDVAAVGGNLNPGEPTVVGSAYTNSSFSATKPTATTLYALDAGDDTLCVQNPPGAGTLVNCKDLRINVRGDAGFDIVGRDATSLGYVVTKDPFRTGSALWRLDLDSGKTVRVGHIGDESVSITGLAAAQDLG